MQPQLGIWKLPPSHPLSLPLSLPLLQMFKTLLEKNLDKWEAYKKEGAERIMKLGEVFSGTKPLTRVEKDGTLIYNNLHDNL